MATRTKHKADGTRSLGLDRNTIRKYIRAAQAAGYKPGEQHTEDEWITFIKKTFPESVDRNVRSSTFSKIDAYRDLIRERLEENRIRDFAFPCLG